MSKIKEKTEEVHHGKLLYSLYLYSGCKNQREFTGTFKRKLKWFTWAKNQITLRPKVREAINQAWSLPEEYWEGKYELPSKNQLQEPQEEYRKQQDAHTKEMEDIRKQLDKKDKVITDLQEQVTELLKENRLLRKGVLN